MPKEVKEKTAATKKKTTPGGAKRGASAYNQFMKTELVRVKKSEPELAHKDAFRKAASNWKYATENPNKIARE
ncbi:hypothetical protein HDU86_004942 [Geranomyces michiganensis]|nr:hypothetical protein HDU86_004942 [Geranomyces michiganensis]